MAYHMQRRIDGAYIADSIGPLNSASRAWVSYRGFADAGRVHLNLAFCYAAV
jgi:hypothetical protein